MCKKLGRFNSFTPLLLRSKLQFLMVLLSFLFCWRQRWRGTDRASPREFGISSCTEASELEKDGLLEELGG